MFITDMTRQQNSEKAKQWSVTLEWKLLLPSNYNLGNSLLRHVIATTVSVSKFKRTHHKHSQHFKICISHLWSCTVVYCIINCKFVFVCNTAIGWKDPPRHRHLCCVCISLEVDLTQTKYNWHVQVYVPVIMMCHRILPADDANGNMLQIRLSFCFSRTP